MIGVKIWSLNEKPRNHSKMLCVCCFFLVINHVDFHLEHFENEDCEFRISNYML